jgi:hypothetical protein
MPVHRQRDDNDLRTLASDQVQYEIELPFGIRTDERSDTIRALTTREAAVEWEEHKSK